MASSDTEGFRSALVALGCDPTVVPLPSERVPEPEPAPYVSLSDTEWTAVQRHISDTVARMRAPEAARLFIDSLLRCEHARVSTRYLPEGETVRQRCLRWTLDGRLERLAHDLRATTELSEDRLIAFDAIAEKARGTRIRILGGRAARLALG